MGCRPLNLQYYFNFYYFIIFIFICPKYLLHLAVGKLVVMTLGFGPEVPDSILNADNDPQSGYGACARKVLDSVSSLP